MDKEIKKLTKKLINNTSIENNKNSKKLRIQSGGGNGHPSGGHGQPPNMVGYGYSLLHSAESESLSPVSSHSKTIEELISSNYNLSQNISPEFDTVLHDKGIAIKDLQLIALTENKSHIKKIHYIDIIDSVTKSNETPSKYKHDFSTKDLSTIHTLNTLIKKQIVPSIHIPQNTSKHTYNHDSSVTDKTLYKFDKTKLSDSHPIPDTYLRLFTKDTQKAFDEYNNNGSKNYLFLYYKNAQIENYNQLASLYIDDIGKKYSQLSKQNIDLLKEINNKRYIYNNNSCFYDSLMSMLQNCTPFVDIIKKNKDNGQFFKYLASELTEFPSNTRRLASHIKDIFNYINSHAKTNFKKGVSAYSDLLFIEILKLCNAHNNDDTTNLFNFMNVYGWQESLDFDINNPKTKGKDNNDFPIINSKKTPTIEAYKSQIKHNFIINLKMNYQYYQSINQLILINNLTIFDQNTHIERNSIYDIDTNTKYLFINLINNIQAGARPLIYFKNIDHNIFISSVEFFPISLIAHSGYEKISDESGNTVSGGHFVSYSLKKCANQAVWIFDDDQNDNVIMMNSDDLNIHLRSKNYQPSLILYRKLEK